MHPNVREVIGHVQLPLLQRLLHLVEYEDTDYVEKLMKERPLLGPCEKTPAFPDYPSQRPYHLGN